MRINHNIPSLIASRNLDKTDRSLALSLERLSTGLRINKAADDPAGLAISQKMRAQISGLNQAAENSETAISMIQTAEGALTEVHNLLISMRELAVHAANEGVNDETMLQADQDQIESVIESIDMIANNTQFGTIKLLDGSKDNTVAVSINNNDIERVSGSTLSSGQHTVQVSGLLDEYQKVNNTSLGLTNPVSVSGLTHGDHTIVVTQASAAAVYTGDDIDFSSTVTITDGSNDMFLVSLDGDTAMTVDIAAGGYTNISDLAGAVETALNAALSSAYSGVTTEIVVSNSDNKLTFTLADEGSSNYIQISEHPTSSALSTLHLDQGVEMGTDAVVTLDNQVNRVTDIDDNNTGTTTLQDADGNTVTFTTGTAADGIELGTTVLSYTPKSFLVDLDGSAPTLFYANEENTVVNGEQELDLVFGNDVAEGTSTLKAVDNAIYFQIGANQNQTVRFSIGSVASSQLGTVEDKLSSVDVTTSAGASRALGIIDSAIEQVSEQRSSMGAFQTNILESGLQSLRVSAENLTAAESTLRDVNMAFEIAEFTKYQIILQSGTAMLAQANLLPQAVLQLLG
jgi:flagellin